MLFSPFKFTFLQRSVSTTYVLPVVRTPVRQERQLTTHGRGITRFALCLAGLLFVVVFIFIFLRSFFPLSKHNVVTTLCAFDTIAFYNYYPFHSRGTHPTAMKESHPPHSIFASPFLCHFFVFGTRREHNHGGGQHPQLPLPGEHKDWSLGYLRI